MNFIIRLLVTAVVAYGLTYILPGVQFTDFKAAILFAVVLAILNMIVKPVLTFLSLPITIITLGLFLLVINGLMILLAAKFITGMHVTGFFWAIVYSIALSLVSGLLNGMLTND